MSSRLNLTPLQIVGNVNENEFSTKIIDESSMFSKGITHWTLLKGLRQCFLGKFHVFIDKYLRNHSKIGVYFQSPRLKLKKMSFLLVHFGNHFGWRKRKNEMYVLWNNSSLAEWIENLNIPLNSSRKIDFNGIFKCLKSWLLFFIKIHQNKDGRVRLHVSKQTCFVK